MTFPIDAVPPPLIPNASETLTGEHLQTLQLLIDQQHSQFGRAISTKQHSAARMAGHLIISAAIGEKPRKCGIVEINPDDGHWVISADWDAEFLNTPILNTTAPEILIKVALHFAAGIAGESIVGLLHPSSSLPDLYRNIVCAVLLDYQFDLPVNTFSVRIASLNTQILDDNFKQFEILKLMLEKKEFLTKAEVSKISKTVKIVDLSSFLGRLQ